MKSTVGTAGVGALGAVVGSALGPVGTIVGGIVGAAVGNKAGESVGANVDDNDQAGNLFLACDLVSNLAFWGNKG